MIAALQVDALALIKIDTEGSEPDVLQGLTGTVTRLRPFILCEVLPVGDVATAEGQIRRARQGRVEGLLRSWDYAMFRLHADASVSPLAAFGVHADLALTNYLFAPAEEKPVVLRQFTMRD